MHTTEQIALCKQLSEQLNGDKQITEEEITGWWACEICKRSDIVNTPRKFAHYFGDADDSAFYPYVIHKLYAEGELLDVLLSSDRAPDSAELLDAITNKDRISALLKLAIEITKGE